MGPRGRWRGRRPQGRGQLVLGPQLETSGSRVRRGAKTRQRVCQGLSASFHTAADPSGTGFNTIFLLIENELSLVAADLITLRRMRF